MTETSRTHPSLALHNGGGRCLGGDVCAAGGASLLGGGDRLSQLRRLVPRQRQLLWGRVRDVVVGHVVDMSWTPPAPQDSAGACRTAPTSPALASTSATASALVRAAARSASASRDRVCCSSASNEAALSAAAAASDAPSAANCSAALPALASSSSCAATRLRAVCTSRIATAIRSDAADFASFAVCSCSRVAAHVFSSASTFA